MKSHTNYISIVLTRAEYAQLERLMESLGMNRSDTVRAALRETAERRGIPDLEVLAPALGEAPPPQIGSENATNIIPLQPNTPI